MFVPDLLAEDNREFEMPGRSQMLRDRHHVKQRIGVDCSHRPEC